MYAETEIIRCLKSKDERCVRMMFDNYYHALCVYALRFLVSVEDSEDIVQDVFVSFWEKKKGTDFEGSLRSYLFGAVSKASLKFLERNGQFYFDDIEKHVNTFLEEMSLCDDDELYRLKTTLRKEIELLPDKARNVLNAIIVENLSYKEVAERYGISVNTVKTHYSHALKKLKTSLGEFFILFIWLEKIGF